MVSCLGLFVSLLNVSRSVSFVVCSSVCIPFTIWWSEGIGILGAFGMGEEK